jgi:hypothetical protein
MAPANAADMVAGSREEQQEEEKEGSVAAAAAAAKAAGGAHAAAASRVDELLWQLCFQRFQAALARQLVALSAAYLVAASQGSLSTSSAEVLLRGSASQVSGALQGTGTPSMSAGGARVTSKGGARTRSTSNVQQLQQADEVRATTQEWMTRLVKVQLQHVLHGLGPQELAAVEACLGTAAVATGEPSEWRGTLLYTTDASLCCVTELCCICRMQECC